MLLMLLVTAGGSVPCVHAQGDSSNPLEPASSGGLAAVDRALIKLSIHARMLVVGAHPDDEDNSLLTWVSQGLGGEAAYLSLSRGEGGQNLIGPELGEELGVIRTGELLAARRIEDTRQYFTRAFDFGYTRSLDETFERWPRESLLEDAVRAARRFKPQVIVAIFPPDARAGHGQHQASAVIAGELFERTGEAALFLELGLAPWSPEAMYRRAWSRDDATLGFSLGALEPTTGRSLGQISADSRSQHRSQDMGRTQPLGDWLGGLVWVEGVGEGGDHAFAGIDTRLTAIASTLDLGAVRSEIEERLAKVESLAREARAGLAPASLERAVPALAEIVRELDGALVLLGDGAIERAVRDLLEEKRVAAAAGLAAAAGVVVDALADSEIVTQGSTLGVTASVWPAGTVEVDVESIELVQELGPPVAARGATTEERGVRSWSLELEVPVDAPPSEPYYLRHPRVGDLYDWRAVPESVRGRADGSPPSVRFDLRIAGAPVRLVRQIVYRYGDQAIGEVRRPVRIVPRIEVEQRPALRVVPLESTATVAIDLNLTSNVDAPVAGRLDLALPDGWTAELPESYSIAEPHGRTTLKLELSPTAVPGPGVLRLAVKAEQDGREHGAAYPTIEYPHVAPVQVGVEALSEVRLLDLALPKVTRIGYVRGASDRVPEMLLEIGLPVELLAATDLRDRDLSVYDVVVVGSRAYEIDSALRQANQRLLDYVRAGGPLIVQYQQYQFVSGGYAPYPLEISQPHGRVTDESSPVHVLAGEHPIFRTPNRIRPEDWDGWVQERGLYFAGEWDEAYTPLLSLQDPDGQPEQHGSLLVAEVGQGTYVYTGLSFFRELPAGVPGAFRLFTNLLALGSR